MRAFIVGANARCLNGVTNLLNDGRMSLREKATLSSLFCLRRSIPRHTDFMGVLTSFCTHIVDLAQTSHGRAIARVKCEYSAVIPRSNYSS